MDLREQIGYNKINITIKNQSGLKRSFKLNKTLAMSRLFKFYISTLGMDSTLHRYRFLIDGERIFPSSTPESLMLEDNDVIDVLLQQTGG